MGFALTVLQRRLASSPEAIYQSLKRRRERLERGLREAELLAGASCACARPSPSALPTGRGLEDLDDYVDEMPRGTGGARRRGGRPGDGGSHGSRAASRRSTILSVWKRWPRVVRVRAPTANGRSYPASCRTRAMSNTSDHVSDDPAATAQAGDLHRTPGHPQLPGRAHPHAAGPAEAVVIIHGGMGREERRKAQESLHPGQGHSWSWWPPTRRAKASTCSAPT